MDISIFGKSVKLNVEQEVLSKVLEIELDGYRVKEENFTSDIEINFVPKIELPKEYSHTPSTHFTFIDGFLIDYGNVKIKFTQRDILYIDIEYALKNSMINQFRAIDFRSKVDNIGLVLHELVFVPMMFFYDENALIHASSMKSRDGFVLMFGGTGGVGKTSLELLLCRELDYSFISDDIAIIDKKSYIYPNLSYPKIYAYNIVGNRTFENTLFENRSFMDKFQWRLFRKIKGDSRVRRSISPFKIFGSVETKSNGIDIYYILSKTDSVDEIEFEEIDYKMASQMTLDIMKNEYSSVLQHIVWHEYNAKLISIEPIITTEEIYKNWLSCYENVLREKKSIVVKIPDNIEHHDFLNQMKKKLERVND